MSKTVIDVEGVSKLYQLGVFGTGSLKSDLAKSWAKLRGKEDPTLKLGEVNDRSVRGTSDYVYALRDINMQVQQGEVLGIIGKNGAGKSTLLKILSNIAPPSTGKVKMRGRVASLLEVGTGFHPELTGRENIFLNGAILGMTKKEINSKLEEIVDFSGVAKYVDTPVKRYSSGMKVRLGFAVAAHLEPEILIVDEVLAVGDAEFQKKAIGKMQDVSSGGGRTVLFVSHNMASINTLCTRAVMVSNGTIAMEGKVGDVTSAYLSDNLNSEINTSEIFDEDKDKPFQILEMSLLDGNNNVSTGIITEKDELILQVKYVFRKPVGKCQLNFFIKNSAGESVFYLDRKDFHEIDFSAEPGVYTSSVKIQNPLLIEGDYSLTFGISDKFSKENDHKFDVLRFRIENITSQRSKRSGKLYLPTRWDMVQVM